MARPAFLEPLLLRQRGHLFPWAPVMLGLGAALYFALKAEPPLALTLAAGTFALALGGVAARWYDIRAALIWAVALAAAGFCLASSKAHLVAGPVLERGFYGAVEGRVTHIDRSSTGALRLTFSEVVLERMPPEKTPARVRVSLHGDDAARRPTAGAIMAVTARLTPPNGPVEPHGFDFQRHAWFQRLGGLGYARSPLMLIEPAGHHAQVAQWRYALSNYVQTQISGEAGAFAAAIITGDRSGLSLETVEHLRRTNLAHLLAISGLHLGLLGGFVYMLIRAALSVSPRLRRLPAKQTAALIALMASFAYLILSGGSVATIRAFVMATVALGAVMLERRVLSLRAVAVAALVLLVLQPEALLGPGFQMSFAATTALVAVFAALRDWDIRPQNRWLRAVFTVFVSSAIAGLATAPFSAAHFNQFSQFGLLANLAAVPMMGLVVVPAAVLALLLTPLGLGQIGFAVLALGAQWILTVAERVAALEGTHGAVLAPGPWVLPLIAAGGLVLILWQGRARFGGAFALIAAALLWSASTRPDVLISPDGKLVGVLTGGSRALSRAKGAGFTARVWLENDGDAVLQPDAAKRWLNVPQNAALHITVLQKKAQLSEAVCAAGTLLVTPHVYEGEGGCLIFDARKLGETGAVALTLTDKGLKTETAREVTGRRLWNSQGQ